jgi:hypothetical protein
MERDEIGRKGARTGVEATWGRRWSAMGSSGAGTGGQTKDNHAGFLGHGGERRTGDGDEKL